MKKLLCINLLIFLLACEKSNLQIKDAENIIYKNFETTGNVTGTVFNRASGDKEADVRVIVLAKGQVIRTKTDKQGSFSLAIDKTLRGEGYNVHFQKSGFQNATRAAVFNLPSHRVVLDDVEIIPISMIKAQQ